MTVKQIAARHGRTIQSADRVAVKALIKEGQRQLQILEAESFGGEVVYICSGNGSCFLSTDKYTLAEEFKGKIETFDVEDDVGVLDYVEPGNRKTCTLVCSKRVKAALIQIFFLCEFVRENNLTTCLPWRLYARECVING